MANFVYVAGAIAMLSAGVNFPSDTIAATILDGADYTPNAATHDAYDDVAAGARVASGNLASKTTTGGTFDAADLVLSAVTGDPTELVLLREADGAESAQQLLILWDTSVSVTPNGGNITLVWNASGILDLTP
jgi:hypothetical protein